LKPGTQELQKMSEDGEDFSAATTNLAESIKKEKKEKSHERTQQILPEEFKELCKPLNDWLQKNYPPHTRIIIENDYAEIVEGIMGIPFEVLG